MKIQGVLEKLSLSSTHDLMQIWKFDLLWQQKLSFLHFLVHLWKKECADRFSWGKKIEFHSYVKIVMDGTEWESHGRKNAKENVRKIVMVLKNMWWEFIHQKGSALKSTVMVFYSIHGLTKHDFKVLGQKNFKLTWLTNQLA